jgi:hypothetical protein
MYSLYKDEYRTLKLVDTCRNYSRNGGRGDKGEWWRG